MKTPPNTPVSRDEMSEANNCTRTTILDAAERLISENGVDGTSVRDITQAAGVNLGSINYHFGTKERLMLEVFARRLEPVNRERIARLDALQAASKNGKVKLGKIIDALIRPALESDDEGADCNNFMRLISRCFQEPNPELKKFVEAQFAQVAQRFDDAILEAAPGLNADELFWRMNFIFGAIHHGQMMWMRFEMMPRPRGTKPAKPDREGLIQRLISFAVAALSAPMPQAA